MSIRMLSQVWDSDLGLTSSEKFVYLALADWADDNGGNVYPSVTTIARKCVLTQRGVRGILRRLEAKGLLVVEYYEGRSSQYRLTPQGHRLPRNQVPTPPEPGSGGPRNEVPPILQKEPSENQRARARAKRHLRKIKGRLT